jgi:hypothetical protein
MSHNLPLRHLTFENKKQQHENGFCKAYPHQSVVNKKSGDISSNPNKHRTPVLNTLNLNLFILEMIPSYLDTV